MNKNIKKNKYETCVKPLRSEFISLVTSESVRQYYDEQDFNSQKLEQNNLFKNKPPPPHHYRYLPNNFKTKKKKKKDTKILGFVLSSEDKKLASYFLIYIIVFICSITLLYLFYTPRNMNLFGFYNDKDLKLKFYQYVLGKKPQNKTSKIIVPTEQTKVYTTEKSTKITERVNNFITTHLTTTTTEMTKTTYLPKINVETTSTTEKNDVSKMTSTTSLIINENTNLVSLKKQTSMKTTCVPVNVTESIEPEEKNPFSTPNYPDEILKNSSINDTDLNTQPTTEINLNKKESFMPKDNTTETIEFQEKISYSNNSHVLKVEKNETIDDETLVDNGILPTEEEEEEKRKDELESKIKIASFFGLDDQNKMKNKLNTEKIKLTTQVENYKALLEEEYKQKNEKKIVKPDKWPTKFKDQKSNNEFYFENRNENKNDEDLKYQPMLRLILRNCNGGCSKF